uniref:Deoxynivalenol-UDP-glucosyltransferase n=1 Tax=Oryza meridionalis TaxID=40149 RepID=A0A0E0DBD3_9ORYZ
MGSKSTPPPAAVTAANVTSNVGDDNRGGGRGHTNPMLQFGRPPRVPRPPPTLVTTRYVLSTTPPPGDPFRVAAISDGFHDDAGGTAALPDYGEYHRSLEAHGARTLAELILSEARAGRPARVLVYDPHLPWARRVARAAGVAVTAFLSQPCAVDLIYGEVCAGRLALPVTPADVSDLYARGALGVELGHDDLPPFVATPELTPAFCEQSVAQFAGLDDADDVLVNSFSDLEPKEAAYMEATWRAKTVGPLLPSFYLGDGQLPSNTAYGFNLFRSTVPCMEWLDKQPPRSVVFVSYGTFSTYVRRSQARGARQWPLQFRQAIPLGYETRTLEAIVNGVPLVAMSHWADQPTISKYMESLWGMGVRVWQEKSGGIQREEVERCIQEVMDGDRKEDYRKSAARLMNKAKEAMQEGGRSDKNIAEFAAKYSK